MSAPLHFQPQLGSAVDEQNRLTIYRPRLADAGSPYDLEFQYSIFRDEKPFEGIGLFVTDSWARERTGTERVFAIDMSTPQALSSAFALKSSFGIDGDDLTFLIGLAHGLVAVFQSRKDNAYPVRYIALGDVEALRKRGLTIDSRIDVTTDGNALLAQVVVPPNRSLEELA
ncbi:hypothetical protein [Stenotrophomonas sp.]|uniref:hypothetical protein n=1 Tax=Stenotrophomonas sp. TaxID=69392 RepID=UPI0028A69499|nr:hypothetical protein [Stenotrophomonas sp.]